MRRLRKAKSSGEVLQLRGENELNWKRPDCLCLRHSLPPRELLEPEMRMYSRGRKQRSNNEIDVNMCGMLPTLRKDHGPSDGNVRQSMQLVKALSLIFRLPTFRCRCFSATSATRGSNVYHSSYTRRQFYSLHQNRERACKKRSRHFWTRTPFCIDILYWVRMAARKAVISPMGRPAGKKFVGEYQWRLRTVYDTLRYIVEYMER